MNSLGLKLSGFIVNCGLNLWNYINFCTFSFKAFFLCCIVLMMVLLSHHRKWWNGKSIFSGALHCTPLLIKPSRSIVTTIRAPSCLHFRFSLHLAYLKFELLNFVTSWFLILRNFFHRTKLNFSSWLSSLVKHS